MKWILHDWDDATCVRLLGICRRAMTPTSRLFVIELVIDPHRSNELAYAMDLQSSAPRRLFGPCRSCADHVAALGPGGDAGVSLSIGRTDPVGTVAKNGQCQNKESALIATGCPKVNVRESVRA